MRRLLVIAALTGILSVAMGCARFSRVDADGSETRVYMFGVDPKVKELLVRKPDGTLVKLSDAEYSSEPGVRMLEMLLDIYEAGVAAGKAGAMTPNPQGDVQVLPPAE